MEKQNRRFKKILTYLTPEQYKFLKKYAKDNYAPMSSLIRSAVSNFIRNIKEVTNV
jgi:hypothetical protein